MFIVKIQGGIGNQMFEYLFGCYLQKKYGVQVKYDTSFFIDFIQSGDSSVDKREFELDRFELDMPTVQKSKINYSKDNAIKKALFNLKNIGKNRQILVREKKFSEFEKKFDEKKDYYFDGFWQDSKYFNELHSVAYSSFVLKKEIQITNLAMLKKIQSTQAVSLHVRRGDYARLGLGTCDDEYYKKAIELLKSKIGEFELFIFSDDLKWVEENMSFDMPLSYINSDNTIPFEDIYLMSQCKHNIIANSTFSWWGAYLNKNSSKIVIAPKVWNKISNPLTDNLVMKEWVKL